MPGPTEDWDSCDVWWVPGTGLYGDIISFNSCTQSSLLHVCPSIVSFDRHFSCS